VNLNLTLFGQLIAFVGFVVFCMKFVWPPIVGAMQERAGKIADGLAAADRASRDLELAKEKAVERLKEAKVEAASIVEAANRRATQLIEEAKNQARIEGDRINAAAQAELQLEINRAREQLRAQVATLAISGAERVLKASIDPAQHTVLLDQLVAEL
jgi:F-type H+-transporting ATPase subunit b